MEIDQKAQELAKQRMEEEQQRSHEAEQKAWDIDEEDWQRACEIEAIKRQRVHESQDTEQMHAREDLDLAAYTKNIK